MDEKFVNLGKQIEENCEEKNFVALRQRVQFLYFERGLSKAEIERQEQLSKKFVSRWTQSSDLDVELDRRGWKKGQGRKYSMSTLHEQVRSLYAELTANQEEFFFGATALVTQWPKRFPDQPVPGLRTVGRTMKELGLVQTKRPRSKGAAAYLCYPEYTIYHGLGGRLLEADFIGSRFLTGRSTPLNFVGFSFKLAPRLRFYERIEAQDANNLLPAIDRFIAQFEKPDFIKVDNCLATAGSASGKRNLSRTMIHMLGHGITPIFAVPRKPFTQASIEGNNSVFSRNFFRRRQFEDLEDLDKQLGWFNASSLRYTGYTRPEIRSETETEALFDRKTPHVIFLRQAAHNASTNVTSIRILNEEITLDRSLTNYYLMAIWDLKNERLNIYLEKEKQLSLQHSESFKINEKSLINAVEKRILSFDT